MNEFELESIRFNMWMPRWLHKGLVNFSARDGRDAADVIRQLISEWLIYKKSSIPYKGYTDNPKDMKKEE
jgi:hypothetical protein